MTGRRKLLNGPEEACACELERRGYRPTKKGWPDFFAFAEGDGRQPIAVEVKPGRGPLRREQVTIMLWLKSLGAECYRWDPADGLQPFDGAGEAKRRADSKAALEAQRQASRAHRQKMHDRKESRRRKKERRDARKEAQRRASRPKPLYPSVHQPLWRLA